jgi:hypothetical protein
LGDVLIHALRCLPFRDSLVTVECAVGRGDMTLDFLRRRLPGTRNGRAREVLRWVDRGAESVLETLARTYFRQAGIRVETQVRIDGVGYVDLLLEGRLIVELDGRHHGDWAEFWRASSEEGPAPQQPVRSPGLRGAPVLLCGRGSPPGGHGG